MKLKKIKSDFFIMALEIFQLTLADDFEFREIIINRFNIIDQKLENMESDIKDRLIETDNKINEMKDGFRETNIKIFESIGTNILERINQYEEKLGKIIEEKFISMESNQILIIDKVNATQIEMKTKVEDIRKILNIKYRIAISRIEKQLTKNEEFIRANLEVKSSEIKTKLSDLESSLHKNASQLKDFFQEKIDNLEEKPIFGIRKDLQILLDEKNNSNLKDFVGNLSETMKTFKGIQQTLSKQIVDFGIESKKDFDTQISNITNQLYDLTLDVSGIPGIFAGLRKVPRKGEWIIIQRRGIFQQKPRISFARIFTEYEKGFGDFENDFWIGLEKIRMLTSSGYTDIKFVITDWDGMEKFAQYSNFTIGDKQDNYRLNVGKYSGTAGDSFTYHNGKQFSTLDSGNDSYNKSCSVSFGGRGGWWFGNCANSNLNGQYFTGAEIETDKGIRWSHWKNEHYYSFSSSEMMLKFAKV